MTNTGWLVIGLIFVSLFLVVGVFLYQKSKNEAELIRQQRLSGLQNSVTQTLIEGNKGSGVGGFLSNTLNSQGGASIISLIGGALLK
jgi:hypothetical protein